jgi:AbrB family looped-hinge helix DNA binding protein
MKSKITPKYQVTIPRKIREKLKLRVSDTIEWKIQDNCVYIERVNNPFLKYKGIIKVGTGDVKEDIIKSRKKLG